MQGTHHSTFLASNKLSIVSLTPRRRPFTLTHTTIQLPNVNTSNSYRPQRDNSFLLRKLFSIDATAVTREPFILRISFSMICFISLSIKSLPDKNSLTFMYFTSPTKRTVAYHSMWLAILPFALESAPISPHVPALAKHKKNQHSISSANDHRHFPSYHSFKTSVQSITERSISS